MSPMPDTESKRPLSPHLQVYKLPYNALMSITGRAVGVGLAKAVAIILTWFTAIIWYPPLYDMTMTFLEFPFVDYFLILTAALTFFYLGNGVRHVLWDFTIGVKPKAGHLTGNITLALTALLTIALWAYTTGAIG